MSVSNPERIVTKQDLADFYDEILPFIAPKAYAGFTPIGTIISVFGESAPANYLICNGATYNVADYPELCAHLWSLTTNSQYKVSGDATKFKVPDLRGEFLRGTGTNGHANGGNGANVGVHQDPTYHPNIGVGNGGTASKGSIVSFVSDNDTSYNNTVAYQDKNLTRLPSGTTPDTQPITKYLYTSSNTVTTGATNAGFASKPTNTSVLFCIATKNIYLDPKNDYSTEEKVVGSWLDGSTIYQKTFALDNITGTTAGTFKSIVTDISSLNIDFIVDIRGIIKSETSFQIIDYRENNGGQQLKLQASTTSLQLVTNMAIDGMKYWVTLRYTKTTS